MLRQGSLLQLYLAILKSEQWQTVLTTLTEKMIKQHYLSGMRQQYNPGVSVTVSQHNCHSVR